MKLNVIITSTRPERKGNLVGEWFFDHAKANPNGFDDVVLTDLAELDLPLYNEPNHPRAQNYQHDKTKKWSQIVDGSDAFVFVLPEYNFSAPPSFYNAVDYLYNEWGYKAAGIVSYGGISGGMRSAQDAKTLLTTVGMMPIPQQVTIPMFTNEIKDGAIEPTDPMQSSADTMLAELYKWTGALKTLR